MLLTVKPLTAENDVAMNRKKNLFYFPFLSLTVHGARFVSSHCFSFSNARTFSLFLSLSRAPVCCINYNITNEFLINC